MTNKENLQSAVICLNRCMDSFENLQTYVKISSAQNELLSDDYDFNNFSEQLTQTHNSLSQMAKNFKKVLDKTFKEE